MKRLLEERFVARTSLERAWAHLERVERYPTWARHIERVELSPSGPLTPSSQGTIVLRNGVRSVFRVTELRPGVSWKWRGPFLWLTVDYDHRFARVGPLETEVTFIVEAEGLLVSVFGRPFAAVYRRNLKRAIPNLLAELESLEA